MAKARLERSMTEGSPTKLILSFALPIVIGNLFQQFYTMVDTIIVGRYVGTKALAAVGSTGMITFLILGFFMGMTAGFSVPISQCYGAQDDVGVRKAVGSAALLSVFFTALITALSVGGMNWLLTLLNTPEEIFTDAYTYIVLLHRSSLRRSCHASAIQYALQHSSSAWQQQNTALFSDPLSRDEHRPRPGVYFVLSYGRRRRSLGHCDLAGRIRAVVPGLHRQKSSHSTNASG